MIMQYCVLRDYPGSDEALAVQVRDFSGNALSWASTQWFAVGAQLIAEFYDQGCMLWSSRVLIVDACPQAGFTVFLKACLRA
jgi:hypothetical protein